MKKYLVITILVAFQIGNLQASDTFNLIEKNVGASIYYNGSEKVVETALEMLIEDSKLVCETPFLIVDEINANTIIVGIPDKDPVIKELTSKYKLDVSDITGKWEAFKIQVLESDGNSYLFVLGSDPRGTAYGVLELSRQIGVTPWVWWADVIPEKKSNVAFSPDGKVHTPSVQYRGIFLNDEDWALMPWGTRTFEPTSQRGAIGPKTYAKIFELLLRLRANTIWPAMHECTVPFFMVEGNKEVAEKYGIVLSTSHAEPMMRTNTGEWDNEKYGDFNFLANKEQVLAYWEDRVKQLNQSENIYTIGMRGIHDGRMQGVSSLDDETQTLHQVIDEQRNMLKRNNPGKDISSIPQIFVPYKEVLKAYNNGLKLPEDVTLVWCDDNNGYIMRLSNPGEQKRSGGAGVYYHVSYWGKPHDYLWLGSTQPGLIYTELKRAWDYGARRLWILNVGDIKPNEYLTEFFLDMAWNVDAFSGNTLYTHQQKWIERVFNGTASDEINQIMQQYYRLAGQRKPEHMGWNKVEDWSGEYTGAGLQPVKDTELSSFYFGDEINKRILAYDEITALSEKIMKDSIPVPLKPAYFQLIHYPVAAAATMNRKILYAQKSRLYAELGLPVAEEYARKATEAYHEITALDYAYNKDMLDGKWELMMDMKPRDLPVFQEPVLPQFPISYPVTSDEVVVWVENDRNPIQDHAITLPVYSGIEGEAFHIVLYTREKNELNWEVRELPEFITVEEPNQGTFAYEKDLAVSINSEDAHSGSFNLLVNGEEYTVNYQINPTTVASPYTERNGMIALNANQHTNVIDAEQVDGLGHSGSAVRLPVAKKINAKSSHLAFKVNTVSSGNVQVKVGIIPKHPANNGDIRYALVVDKQKPQIISIAEEFLSKKWADNVLRNQSLVLTNVFMDAPGEHTIRIYALDEDILVDQLMLEFIPDRQHYLIPAQ